MEAIVPGSPPSCYFIGFTPKLNAMKVDMNRVAYYYFMGIIILALLVGTYMFFFSK